MTEGPSRRERERQRSLDALAGLLRGRSLAAQETASEDARPTAASASPAAPREGATPPGASPVAYRDRLLEEKRRRLEAAELARAATARQSARPRPIDPTTEGKLAKLEEERRLRARREAEMTRATSLRPRTWVPEDDMPQGVYRPRGSREASVEERVRGVLGEKAPEKEGRAKHRDRGRRERGK